MLLACIGAGFAVGKFAPVRYSYSAVLSGGTLHALTTRKPFVTADALAGQLQQIYIPEVLRAAAHDRGGVGHVAVTVNVAEGTQLVTVAAKAPARSGAEVSRLLTAVAHAAGASVNQRIQSYVARRRTFLSAQIANLRTTLARLEKQSTRLDRSGADGPSAAALAAVEISRLTTLLGEYREKLEVDLPSRVEEAGLVAAVTRSAEPVSWGLLIWAGLGAFAGVVLGLLVAAFVELVAGVRRRLHASP